MAIRCNSTLWEEATTFKKSLISYLRGPTVNNIGSYEFLGEVMNCKKRYFRDFDMSA